jgi:hypothetical protein
LVFYSSIIVAKYKRVCQLKNSLYLKALPISLLLLFLQILLIKGVLNYLFTIKILRSFYIRRRTTCGKK